jgi:hypothetical protein
VRDAAAGVQQLQSAGGYSMVIIVTHGAKASQPRPANGYSPVTRSRTPRC